MYPLRGLTQAGEDEGENDDNLSGFCFCYSQKANHTSNNGATMKN